MQHILRYCFLLFSGWCCFTMKWESGLRTPRSACPIGTSANPWEFITRTVPKEALARGKPLEKPRTQGLPWGRSKTLGSSKEVVPPCNSLKLERGRDIRANEDVPLNQSRDLSGVIRSRPRKIRVLLSGTPQKQKLVPERNGRSSIRFSKERIPQGMWLVGISHEVNLEYEISRRNWSYTSR